MGTACSRQQGARQQGRLLISCFDIGARWVTWARRYNELNHKRFEPGTEGRQFAYFVQTGGRFLYASAIRLVVLKGLVSLSVRGAMRGCVTGSGGGAGVGRQLDAA